MFTVDKVLRAMIPIALLGFILIGAGVLISICIAPTPLAQTLIIYGAITLLGIIFFLGETVREGARYGENENQEGL